MNIDLFIILSIVWVFIYSLSEYIYYYFYIANTHDIAVKIVFTLLFTKKHFIFDIVRYGILVVAWAVMGAFSNLDLIINYEMNVCEGMLYFLEFGFLMGRAYAALVGNVWNITHNTM